MPDDARRALLTRFFDHAPTFPPASLAPSEALDEDRRARQSEHAWLLGRLVWPAAQLSEIPPDEARALAVVDAGTGRPGGGGFPPGGPARGRAAGEGSVRWRACAERGGARRVHPRLPVARARLQGDGRPPSRVSDRVGRARLPQPRRRGGLRRRGGGAAGAATRVRARRSIVPLA